MANAFHNKQVAPSRQGKAPSSAKKGGTSSFTEKVGFSKAELPGGTQSKDRSGGVSKAKAYPDKKGL